MKSIILFFLIGYKTTISPLLHQLVGQQRLCRYEISCSDFAQEAIRTHGLRKGCLMSLKRLLSCQPLTKPYATV